MSFLQVYVFFSFHKNDVLYYNFYISSLLIHCFYILNEKIIIIILIKI